MKVMFVLPVKHSPVVEGCIISHLKYQTPSHWQMPENKSRGHKKYSSLYNRTFVIIVMADLIQTLNIYCTNIITYLKMQNDIWYCSYTEITVPLYRLVNEMSLAKSDV